jgi:hypothetical protein
MEVKKVSISSLLTSNERKGKSLLNPKIIYCEYSQEVELSRMKTNKLLDTNTDFVKNWQEVD